MSTPVTLQPVTPADFEDIARLEAAAFRDNPVSVACFGPNRGTPEAFAIRAKSLDKFLHQPTKHLVKAVTADGVIVGVAIWDFSYQPNTEENTNNKSDKAKTLPPGANLELITKYFGAVTALAKKNMEGKAYATLAALAVDPEYQRKGIGEMLLREGLRKTDEAELPTILGATDKGAGLYRKVGYVERGIVEMDWRAHGVDASTGHLIMVRPVKAVNVDL